MACASPFGREAPSMSLYATLYGVVGLVLGLWLCLTPRLRYRWHSHSEYFCHGRPCWQCWIMAAFSVFSWPLIAIVTIVGNNDSPGEPPQEKP